jgi:hypothetical protein
MNDDWICWFLQMSNLWVKLSVKLISYAYTKYVIHYWNHKLSLSLCIYIYIYMIVYIINYNLVVNASPTKWFTIWICFSFSSPLYNYNEFKRFCIKNYYSSYKYCFLFVYLQILKNVHIPLDSLTFNFYLSKIIDIYQQIKLHYFPSVKYFFKTTDW